ncbi:hypothetical protein, partial [Caldalkalibacillus salinus]|uniref:hypothetical protein n=1 Tax=Caldalkalibacillus salinus TaxID=2803787 RepID=UPI001921D6C7
LAQQLRMIQLTEAKCHVVQRPLREIIEEIKEIKLDQFENDILQSSVPPKYHWFVYLTEGVETAFEIHEDMVAYDFHQGQLWVNPNLVVGDVQGV